MKAVVLVVAVLIMAFGAVGVVYPTGLVSLAGHFATSGAFYLVAAVRVALGLAIVAVAPTSRVPRTLRVVGYLVVVSGAGSALIGMLAVERADALIQWWVAQGLGVVRLTGVGVAGFGAFLAYACTPARHTA